MSRSPLTVGLLHPGWMGAAVGRQATKTARVLWTPAGRTAATADRAEAAGLHAVPDLATLVDQADLVVSLCPPQFAEQVAAAVLDADFRGLFLEANAISPERAVAIAERFDDSPARLVDASIIGPPPTGPGTTRLYLAGSPHDATAVLELFSGTDLDAVAISECVGAASALKTAQAAFQKASRALAGIAHALADHYGVADVLTDEGRRRSRPILAEPDYLPSVAARAWRWGPEMADVAAALRAAGLPDTMILGAEEIFQAWSRHRDNPPADTGALFTDLRPPTGRIRADVDDG
jgi:3-hydroxyisobutyrate dehydrogenase-like beta-hydroxyacid dehydrogenase